MRRPASPTRRTTDPRHPGLRRIRRGAPVRAACAVALALLSLGEVRAQDLTYEVQPGDTVAGLALRSTGDASRFVELVDANPLLGGEGGGLRPGTLLRLPPGWGPPRPREELLGRTVPGRRADAVVQEGEPQSDALLEPATVPAPHLWERLTFFPALRELEREFELLMLRASYNADVDWGADRVAERQARTRSRLEQEILLAEVARDEASARRDTCREAASRAHRLLSKYARYGDSEFEITKREALKDLSEAVTAEQRLWEVRFWRMLSPQARNDWEDYRDALERGEWYEAFARHEVLEGHRVLLGPVDPPLDDDEELAFAGAPVDDALRAILNLQNDKAYRIEHIQRQRYLDALKDLERLETCERGFTDAERFLQQKKRKLVALQSAVSAGTGNALEVDARRLADMYSGILGEVQLVDAWLSNGTWSGLWWKSGIALRLAGEDDLGARRIAQAAAVADDHRLPDGEIPPSLESWLRDGENEVLRRRNGLVLVHVPPTAELTVDGRDIRHAFGETEIYLAPGIHRFVFWVDGSQPLMRLVGVQEGETHEFVWWESSELSGEEEFVAGVKPSLPDLAVEEPPKRWHVGIRAVAGLNLGRPMAGGHLSIRYLPRMIGGELGVGVMGPFEPYWLDVTREMPIFARLDGYVLGRADFGRVDVVGGVGAYGDPLLGAGPSGKVEVGVWVKERVRIAFDVHGGYDATPHFDGIPPFTLAGAFGVWL